MITRFIIAILLVSVLSVTAQVPVTNLVAYYPFSGNANDSSGNGYNGTVNGASLTSDRFGNSNSAYCFDGLNDYIMFSNAGFSQFSNPESDFTMSAWYYTNNQNGVMLANLSADGWMSLKVLNSGTIIMAECLDNEWGVAATVNSDLLTSNTWHFVAMTMDYPVLKLYIDSEYIGMDIASKPLLTYGNTTNGGAKTGVGWLPDAQYYKGFIDEVRFYNRALTDTEITNLYEGFNTDTTIYYVSSPEFESVSPLIHFEGVKSLPTGTANVYSKFVYEECSGGGTVIHDTVYITQTKIIRDTVFVNSKDTLYMEVEVTGTTGTYLNTVKVYPNPASNRISVDCGNYEEMDNYTLRFIHVSGEEMWTRNLSSQIYSIDISGYIKGAYFMQVFDNHGILMDAKCIIIR